MTMDSPTLCSSNSTNFYILTNVFFVISFSMNIGCIHNKKIGQSSKGNNVLRGGITPSSQTVGSYLSTPWLAKPVGKMIGA
jgi:hypothetical protein